MAKTFTLSENDKELVTLVEEEFFTLEREWATINTKLRESFERAEEKHGKYLASAAIDKHVQKHITLLIHTMGQELDLIIAVRIAHIIAEIQMQRLHNGK